MQNPFGNNNNNNQNPFDLNNLPLPPNYAKIVNDQGQIRIAKVGISWTTLWFGPLPALFRGDYYNFILMIVLDLDYALVVLFFGLNWLMQFPWPSLVFAILYNMMFFKHSFNIGYRPADQRSRELLERFRYIKKE
ncbi:MAG: hypothetical protein H9843_02590 [Candidatus Limosilactobacillus merdavium]|uniref:DUF2628 domain-containing protein n=1 Tax=Candidatus Limosilactobacillus merdavium TaxID=2838651 RepID=A0A9E2NUY9_9LACO|nr:hypothetical protein [Candidatus Limosilactobacillus merdavium]